jgi:ligand-binding sensor domain-containing protein
MIYTSLFAQKITTFKRSNGLVDNYVYAVIQAHQPKEIWIGTREGLGIYNNQKLTWQAFHQNDSLRSKKVLAILQDANDHFWFGTDNGISRFDGKKWIHYPNQDMPSNILTSQTQITCFFLDTRNNIWIGTRGRGVIKYFVTASGEQWAHYYTGCPGIINITAINEDREGNIWLGTLDSSICKFDGRSIETCTSYRDRGVGNRINAIFKDQSGTLWIGTDTGVTRTDDGSTWDNSGVATIPSAQTIMDDREGNLWIATETGVLYLYDQISSSKSPVQLETSPPITAMIRDDMGYIWLATAGNGISRLHLNWQSFDTTNSALEDNYITGIAEDRDGNLWIATDSHYIFKYDGTVFTKIYVSCRWEGMNEVNSIMVDKDNNIWCATEMGAHRFDGMAWESFTKPEVSIVNNIVKTMIQDQQGVFWFGTQGGVSRFDGKTWTSAPALPSILINAIFEDDRGHLWFGTSEGVYEYFNDSIITIFNATNGLLDNDVTAINQDQEFKYWFATRDGIARWDRDKNDWTYITEDSGLTHNYVQTIFKDHSKNIWIGTYEGGISKFDGRFWWNYSANVVSNEIYSIFQDSKDNFWFGTTNGLVKFIPDNSGPETIITYSPIDTIGIASGLFSFIGSDIETPKETLVYSWALEENNSMVAPRWSDFSRKTYEQVGPLSNGTYVFYVKAIDSEGNEDNTPAQSLPFTVDVTAPTVIIDQPIQDQVISGNVAIKGTAVDNSSVPDFEHCWLDYVKGYSRSSIPDTGWELINDTLSTPISDSLLTIWNVSGLNGYYFLRLTAEDRRGHISVATVRVQVVENLRIFQKEQGGRIVSWQNKAQLYIPPGALKTDVLVHLNPLDTSKVLIADDAIKKSALAYQFGPEQTQLQKPAILTFNYCDSDIAELEETRLSLLYYDSAQKYELLGGN